MLLLVIIIVAFLIFVGKIMRANAVSNRREGKEDKTLAQNALIGGIGCLAIPAVCLVGILLVIMVVRAFYSVKMLFDLGHPITIFFCITSIIGSIGILYSGLKR